MATTQLNCRVEVLLAKRLREAATARHTTTGALVAQAIEALLAGNSASPAPPPSALAALEARVAKLEAANQGSIRTLKNNDESRCDNATSTKSQPVHDNIMDGQGPDIVRTSQGLTTAELAIQTGTNKAAWNNWASKAAIGDIRHHPQAGSWRLLGKAAPASGGPERWMWEPAG
jgi:hypothetical protein